MATCGECAKLDLESRYPTDPLSNYRRCARTNVWCAIGHDQMPRWCKEQGHWEPRREAQDGRYTDS